MGDRWQVDEAYVKVIGQWRYVYRAIDQFGQVIDMFVSPRRDAKAAHQFFERAIGRGRAVSRAWDALDGAICICLGRVPSMDDLRAVPAAPLTVAAGQAACTALDLSANVAAAADLVRRAAGQGAAVLVLPELFLTGYELPAIVADSQTYTLNPTDLRLDPLATACAQTRTAVVVGAPTLDPASGGLRISALVLGRDGRVAARYDKQHVDPAERAAGFRPGTSGCTLTLDGWRLGLGICWDASFPEHARAAALDGCQAYLVGAMFGRGRGAHKRATVCPARALDNAGYVVVANHSGPSGPYHGCGGSAVWNPDGALLVDAGLADPGLATARLGPEVLARARAEDLVLVDPSLSAPVHPRSGVTLD